ncbi:FAD-dependent monooxygenase [Pedococcus sp. P5_B7]
MNSDTALTSSTPVLIVGGGPVGFAVALDLGQRGIQTTIVEQDAGTGLVVLTKAGVLNERSMELCRRWGIAEAAKNVGFPDDHPRDVFYCTSLNNGFLLGRDALESTDDRRVPEQTAEMLRKCPQFKFDPIIAEAAIATGMVDVMYSTKFRGMHQDDDGVTVQLEDLATGARKEVRTRYLIGCDGAGSLVRQSVNIDFSGDQLDYSVTAMIRIENLEYYHPHGRGERYLMIDEKGVWGNFVACDGQALYKLTVVGSEEKLQLDVADIEALMLRVLGRDDVPFEVLRVLPWRRSHFVADRYREGRVLIAGDACHTMSPTGGHGLNTGLGDVSDLTWMLQALLEGWGGPELLDAYTIERRPVAIRNGGSSTKNYVSWTNRSGRDLILQDTPEGEAQRHAVYQEMSAQLVQEWYSLGIGMGYRYEGSPLIVDDGSPSTKDDPIEYVQTAKPGHRAPHVWLDDNVSIIDLFGDGFVLLDFCDDNGMADPIVSAAADAGLPLTVHQIDSKRAAELYKTKLALVRPDGIVAWRGDTAPLDPREMVDVVRGFAPAHVTS